MHAIGEVLLCDLVVDIRHGGTPGSYRVHRRFAECEYCNVYDAPIRAGSTNGEYLLCFLSVHSKSIAGSLRIHRHTLYTLAWVSALWESANGKGSARKVARNHDAVLQARGCERIQLLSGHHSDSRLHGAQG
jgi:hypothetical protein